MFADDYDAQTAWRNCAPAIGCFYCDHVKSAFRFLSFFVHSRLSTHPFLEEPEEFDIKMIITATGFVIAKQDEHLRQTP